ncbi:MAG: T9SS type A sorting domain-containing protein, partial [Elusimicrobiota bacterium]|nr:T9SS type A sorting domain-containing protein [Elusimicrobiota bacterium]
LTSIIDKVSKQNDNNKIPVTEKGKKALNEEGKLKIEDEDKLVLSTGTYYLKSIEIGGKAKLVIDGEVRILCIGEIEFSGQAEINYNNHQKNLVIFQSSWGPNIWTVSEAEDNDDEKDDKNDDESKIEVAGQVMVNAIIYAPFAETEVSGQAKFTGNIFSKESKVSGKGAASKEIILPASYSSASLNPKSSILNPSFAFGEVYAYPNPAKQTNPTIHIEVGGIADRLEIRIYNISAELLHSVEIPGSEYKILDNKYCYEYTWNVSNIASGVYIYLVRAKHGDKAIKVLKKLGIVK